jgi:hypothetical protein
MEGFWNKDHIGKWPEAGCIDALRTLSKIRKAGAQPAKLAEMKEEEKAYLASDAHTKWAEGLAKGG